MLDTSILIEYFPTRFGWGYELVLSDGQRVLGQSVAENKSMVEMVAERHRMTMQRQIESPFPREAD